jgi:hypothetical protein
MTMTTAKRRLVRILWRLRNRVDATTQRHLEAYEYDRQFDAGEFCGAFLDSDIERSANAHARALGFASFELATRIERLVVGRDIDTHLCYHVADNKAAFFGYDYLPDGSIVVGVTRVGV